MIRRIIASCCIALSLILPTVGVSADSVGSSVSVSYRIEDNPVQDLEFSIYDVGDVENNNISWNPEYSEYNIGTSLDGNVAPTLYGYIQRDNIQPSGTNKTDSGGICTFQGLDDGLYLIAGDVYKTSDCSYYVQPLLANVPSSGVIEVKHEAIPTGNEEGESKKLSVKKVWDSDRILDSVSVDLLKDGNLYKTVELSKKNNWSYTWNNLPSNKHYSVVESKVPDGYKVDVVSSKSIWTITNKQTSGHESPTIKPGQQGVNLAVPSTQYGGTLPQTGMPHMLVLVLCGLSVIFGIVGIVLIKVTKK